MSPKLSAALSTVFLAVLVAMTVPAAAQSTSATIRGTVKDETGALPGASIEAQGSQ